MANDFIHVLGCREGNLQNVNVSIPYGDLVAITGVSGSGKSSFAFETLYAEGRRQLLEALDVSGNNFFLSQNCSPLVDMILGLPPTIAIKQNRHIRSSMSTMGSISHINSYLFSIFSSCGEIKCAKCNLQGKQQYNNSYLKKCPECHSAIPIYSPAFFSSQSPYGACQTCGGSGEELIVDETLLYPDQSLSINAGGLKYGVPTKGTTKYKFFENFLMQFGVNLNTPICDFSNEAKVALLYGIKKSKKIKLDFPGIVPDILRLYKESHSETIRTQLGSFLAHDLCTECNGMGISIEAQNVFIHGKNVCSLQNMNLVELSAFIKEMSFGDFRDELGALPKKKVVELCDILIQLGVGYLTLNRKTASLSGGEMHRITMATFLASQLTGVFYILDEPSTGLHWHEIPNLLKIIKQLNEVGNGNTVAIVEHNKRIIQETEYIVEFGPGPSKRGGQVVFQGKLKDLPDTTATGKLLNNTIGLRREEKRKPDFSDTLTIKNARSNNLKNITVDIPLHCLTAITGVSGSGKSSLVFDTFYLEAKTKSSRTRSRVQAELINRERINQIITCEQAPIAQNNRSIVATYIDVFSLIRDLFEKTATTQKRKVASGTFSFNTKEGACICCNGYGYITPNTIAGEDTRILCPQCSGRRYKDEVLEIKYKEKNISEILNMDISEAICFFEDKNHISSRLKILSEVGLDYLQLGQCTAALSGGERQRLKLALNLMSGKQKNSLYIFDEPSAGLHALDLQKILSFFDKLIAEGNTVVIVEHNIELISLCDYVIDLGPGAGEYGGQIIAKGCPEDICHCNSLTGQELKQIMSKGL